MTLAGRNMGRWQLPSLSVSPGPHRLRAPHPELPALGFGAKVNGAAAKTSTRLFPATSGTRGAAPQRVAVSPPPPRGAIHPFQAPISPLPSSGRQTGSSQRAGAQTQGPHQGQFPQPAGLRPLSPGREGEFMERGAARAGFFHLGGAELRFLGRRACPAAFLGAGRVPQALPARCRPGVRADAAATSKNHR